MEEEEVSSFFKTLLPKMVHLALQLPVLITGGIPLLKSHSNASISLSQLQVSSLLANAFFCTFPRRNSANPQSEYSTYPHINFNRYNNKLILFLVLKYKFIFCLFFFFLIIDFSQHLEKISSIVVNQ